MNAIWVAICWCYQHVSWFFFVCCFLGGLFGNKVIARGKLDSFLTQQGFMGVCQCEGVKLFPEDDDGTLKFLLGRSMAVIRRSSNVSQILTQNLTPKNLLMVSLMAAQWHPWSFHKFKGVFRRTGHMTSWSWLVRDSHSLSVRLSFRPSRRLF